jgi:hypothetical protein
MTDKAKDSGIIAKFADGAVGSQPVASSECNGAGFATSEADEKIYPCYDCGLLRSKKEGGTTFTVCDKCWERHYGESRTGKPRKSANDLSSATHARD